MAFGITKVRDDVVPAEIALVAGGIVGDKERHFLGAGERFDVEVPTGDIVDRVETEGRFHLDLLSRPDTHFARLVKQRLFGLMERNRSSLSTLPNDELPEPSSAAEWQTFSAKSSTHLSQVISP